MVKEVSPVLYCSTHFSWTIEYYYLSSKIIDISFHMDNTILLLLITYNYLNFILPGQQPSHRSVASLPSSAPLKKYKIVFAIILWDSEYCRDVVESNLKDNVHLQKNTSLFKISGERRLIMCRWRSKPRFMNKET